MNSKEPFDPLRNLWAFDQPCANDVATVNLRALSLFHRALLVTDGTVTKFIEITTMEPVGVVRLIQSQQVLDRDHAWLMAPKDTAIIHREVMLEGKYSRAFYVHATSLLVPDRLPQALRARLEAEGEGIGRVLQELEVETRREVLWYGREHLSGLPGAISGRADGEFVSRTYRIFIGGRPVALIHEKFPVAVHNLPSMD